VHPGGSPTTNWPSTGREGWVLARGILGPAFRSRHANRSCPISRRAGSRLVNVADVRIRSGPVEADAGAARVSYSQIYWILSEDAPALKMAAMNQRLHVRLDQLLGHGRVLFQEMALVKPPTDRLGKPWHQDASYFRVTDPGLIVGVWILARLRVKAQRLHGTRAGLASWRGRAA